MIPPTPTDLEVTAREALFAPSGPAQERDRSDVVRLDVRLEPMQTELVEREAEHGGHGRSHHASAVVRDERVVAEVRVAERAVHDLRQRVHTGEVLAAHDGEWNPNRRAG